MRLRQPEDPPLDSRSLREQVEARWSARVAEWKRLNVQVSGAALAEEVLADLQALAQADAGDLLTLREAAEASGFSEDHLGRLLREGKVPNAGRAHAPRIRRADLPRKPGATLPHTPSGGRIDRARIARAVITSHNGGHDD